MSDDTLDTFFVTGNDGDGVVTEWTTPRTRRGYTAVIEYSTVTGLYTLTITGSGAPAAADYNTLRNARNAYRKFLLDKPEL